MAHLKAMSSPNVLFLSFIASAIAPIHFNGKNYFVEKGKKFSFSFCSFLFGSDRRELVCQSG